MNAPVGVNGAERPAGNDPDRSAGDVLTQGGTACQPRGIYRCTRATSASHASTSSIAASVAAGRRITNTRWRTSCALQPVGDGGDVGPLEPKSYETGRVG
jgi:hypothetical protein